MFFYIPKHHSSRKNRLCFVLPWGGVCHQKAPWATNLKGTSVKNKKKRPGREELEAKNKRKRTRREELKENNKRKIKGREELEEKKRKITGRK